MPSSPPRQHPEFYAFAMAFGGLLLVVHGLYLSHLQGGGMVDDAYITFRYADQLLSGHGAVFNPGERVEGYSNFLWLLGILPLRHLSLSLNIAIEPLVLALGLSMGVAVLWYAGRLIERFTGAAWLAVLGSVLLAADGSFARWCIDGLETPLFALLLLLACLAELDERQRPRNPEHVPDEAEAAPSGTGFHLLAPRRLIGVTSGFSMPGFYLGLASLTRAEGVGFLGLFVLYRLGVGLSNLLKLSSSPGPVGRTLEDRSPSLTDAALWRSLARLLLTAGTLIVAHLIFRRVYYQEWLPNTAYIKVHPGLISVLRGLRYEVMFLVHRLPLLFGLGLAYWLGRKDRKTNGPAGRWPLRFMLVLVLGCAANILLVGGDWMGWGRFWVPVMPLVSLLWVERMARLMGGGQPGRGYPRHVGAAILMSLCILGSFITSTLLDEASRMRKAGRELNERRAIASWLKEHARADQVLLTEEIGYIPFHTGLKTLDVYGLIDPHIAREGEYDPDSAPGHQKTDLNYSLSRQPDFLVMAEFHNAWQKSAFPSSSPARFPALSLYEPVRLTLPEGRLEIYRRRTTEVPVNSTPRP